jgi:hypothetical protein
MDTKARTQWSWAGPYRGNLFGPQTTAYLTNSKIRTHKCIMMHLNLTVREQKPEFTESMIIAHFHLYTKLDVAYLGITTHATSPPCNTRDRPAGKSRI